MGKPIQSYSVRTSSGVLVDVYATHVEVDGCSVTFYINEEEDFGRQEDMVAYFPNVDYVIQVEEEDDAELADKG